MLFASKSLATLQIILGLSGILLCGYLYRTHCTDLQQSLENLDGLAADANVQAEIGDGLLLQWSNILKGFDQALDTHRESLFATRQSTERISESLQEWDEGLDGFNSVALDAEQICRKFARQLPLKIPNLDVDTRPLVIDVPNIQMQTENAKIPYPTASVGTRKVKLNVGLTDLEFDVPTLNVGTRNKTIRVPGTPVVTNSPQTFNIPDKVNVTYQNLFDDEKKLLLNVADQLEQTTRLVDDSRQSLDSVEELLSQEVTSSIQITEFNLENTQRALKETYDTQIPEVRERLASQQLEIQNSQLNFRSLKSMVPWLFLLASMLPMAITLQGMIAWTRSGNSGVSSEF